MSNIFENIESNVRSYCRSFPTVFDKAKGASLYSIEGKEYIDFFAGAGALNYGHNNDYIKNKILDYITSDRIIHGLDMYTKAKEEFLEEFNKQILERYNYDYKIMFCGPTGTNAIEAALKLCRKNMNRQNVFAFSGAFHGMSLGSLSMTTDSNSRLAAGVSLDNVTFMPYPNKDFVNFDTIEYIENVLQDDHSGIDKPAAIFLETVQAEGGINIAPTEWIKRLSELCKRNNILLVCDEIQVGCGRTGSFLSFQRANIKPDMLVLAKSISGYGLPMSMLLIKSKLDIWKPGEHNGTFRGNQLAFVGAKAALEYYFENELENKVSRNNKIINEFITTNILTLNEKIEHRGLGMIFGIDFMRLDPLMAKKITKKCFENGLVLECAGRMDSVVKLMPPLIIEENKLMLGLNILKQSIKEVLIEYAK